MLSERSFTYMMLFLKILLLIVGFVLLVKGADWFVDGAAGVAGKLKVPELVVGLTIVAFGTSAPELSVSITSAFQGSADLTVGNVIGSNIINILLILGLTAVVHEIPVHKNSLRSDLPFLIAVSLLFAVVGYVGMQIGRIDGVVLFALLILYVGFLIRQALVERKKALAADCVEEEAEEAPKGKIRAWYARMCGKAWFLIVITVVGLVCVIGGSDFVVDSATYIAQTLGIDERIIGLTVIAIGTSLPELVTSVTAARKGKTDIAVGNIIGSNIFNLLCVAGFTSILFPLEFSLSFTVDALIALGATVLLAVLSYLPKHRIGRMGGVLLLVCCAGYFAYLFITA